MKRKVNKVKSAKVKAERGFAPEEVATGTLLDVKPHPKDPDQEIEVYEFNNYVWAVVVGKNPPRFITAWPSEKFKKEYGK